jgi:hypothetical protein
MTERERWIVYPLLFLALGAALRDKLGGRTTTKSIVCQELRIEDEPIGNQPARVLALLGRGPTNSQGPAYGYLYVNGEIKVDGIVDADRYSNQLGPNGSAYQLLPGVSLPDFLRAMQAGKASASPNPQNGEGPRKAQSDDQSSPSRPGDSAKGGPPASSNESAAPK